MAKASHDKTGLHSTVASLFSVTRDALYRYKRYTDVRRVMAPELNAAYFGGDLDNFEYPGDTEVEWSANLLASERDVVLPRELNNLWHQDVLLANWSAESRERPHRQA